MYSALHYTETVVDIGRWWYNGHEVDVVGLTAEGALVVGACTFTNSPLDYGALASLETHADHIRWKPHGSEPQVKYALFSRNGTTPSVQEAVADRETLRSFDLHDQESSNNNQRKRNPRSALDQLNMSRITGCISINCSSAISS